jgi:hypothetical protein
MKKIKFIFSLMFAIAITLSLFIACQPDDNTGVGNGILGSVLDASFTVTPVTGKSNTYILKATATNYIGSKWDMGNGAGTTDGKSEETLFIPDAGTYTITHTAVGIGGQLYSASKNIVVATSDPIAGNMVQGGKFENAADWAKWTKFNKNATDPMDQWKFFPGYATFTPPGHDYLGGGIYQIIDVEANKKYKIDMIVSCPVGLVESWFEVYCLATPPVVGTDYGDAATQGTVALHTWSGTGLVPFNGKISVIGKKTLPFYDGVTFPTSGKVYLMIRSGTNNTTPTITLKNVEMRAVN